MSAVPQFYNDSVKPHLDAVYSYVEPHINQVRSVCLEWGRKVEDWSNRTFGETFTEIAKRALIALPFAVGLVLVPPIFKAILLVGYIGAHIFVSNPFGDMTERRIRDVGALFFAISAAVNVGTAIVAQTFLPLGLSVVNAGLSWLMCELAEWVPKTSAKEVETDLNPPPPFELDLAPPPPLMEQKTLHPDVVVAP